MFVKMCGLRDAEAAQVAVDAGADALGFILADSRRRIAASTIGEIRRTLQLPDDGGPLFVGVTVNASPDAIAIDVRDGSLDAIQLSGDEHPSILAKIEVPVVKALRFPAGMLLDDALREVDGWLSAARPVSRLIVEGHAEGAYGGAGIRADWEFVARIAERYPIVLAGGLNPENVAEAISIVQPAGVDVSSGTETEGVKDHTKIQTFISNARAYGVRPTSIKE